MQPVGGAPDRCETDQDSKFVACCPEDEWAARKQHKRQYNVAEGDGDLYELAEVKSKAAKSLS